MHRGRMFLRLGLVDLASNEFSKLEELYASRPQVSRIVARLLDAAKAWEVSHRQGASRITNPDHYPAPDSIDDWTVAYPKPFDEFVTHYADERGLEDRKSTRLNSSHVAISYAVFCLKKKKKTRQGHV